MEDDAALWITLSPRRCCHDLELRVRELGKQRNMLQDRDPVHVSSSFRRYVRQRASAGAARHQTYAGISIRASCRRDVTTRFFDQGPQSRTTIAGELIHRSVARKKAAINALR